MCGIKKIKVASGHDKALAVWCQDCGGWCKAKFAGQRFWIGVVCIKRNDRRIAAGDQKELGTIGQRQDLDDIRAANVCDTAQKPERNDIVESDTIFWISGAR